jgi:serine/threonine protein kinase
MSDVYRAHDTPVDHRLVAIKVLHHGPSADAVRRLRLEREAAILSRLAHPNICCLYDVGEHDDATYLVLELLEGETLSDQLGRSRGRPLAATEVMAIATEIADALAAAHRRGIVHRD